MKITIRDDIPVPARDAPSQPPIQLPKIWLFADLTKPGESFFVPGKNVKRAKAAFGVWRLKKKDFSHIDVYIADWEEADRDTSGAAVKGVRIWRVEDRIFDKKNNRWKRAQYIAQKGNTRKRTQNTDQKNKDGISLRDVHSTMKRYSK